MQMPVRTYTASSSLYRYGFNGKENDNEVKGIGNQQDYGMRIYDPRVGRFLSVDPITSSYPELTPYQFASNRPIDGIDQDGLEYAPAGLTNYGPRDATAVQLYPLNATEMQKISTQIAARANYLNQQIAAPDVFGNGHIGPRYTVQINIASIKQNYYNAVGDNIAGGPIGATSYMIGGEQSSFYGAAGDQIVMSFGGIPGKSSVLSRPQGAAIEPTFIPTEIEPNEQLPVQLTINLRKNWSPQQVSEAYEKAQAITDNTDVKVNRPNTHKTDQTI